MSVSLIGRFGRSGSFHNRRGRKQATRLSQRGLDFGRDQSVTADDARVLTTRDPAPPAIGLLRGFGGDGAGCRRSTKKGSQHAKQ